MTRRCIVFPAAQTEIDQQADYLAQHAGAAVAHRFLVAIEQTLTMLLATPGVGGPWISDHPRLQNIRRHKVGGFPNYSLFYRHDPNTVEILHLYHAKQDIGSRLDNEADASDDWAQTESSITPLTTTITIVVPAEGEHIGLIAQTA